MQVDAMSVRCVVQPVWRCSAIWSTWPLGFVGITSWRESKPSRWRRCFFGCSVAAGFIDRQYASFLSFFFFLPREFRNASGLGGGVRKYTLRGLKKERTRSRRHSKRKKRQHNGVGLGAKCNEWHDAGDDRILVTQITNKEGKKNP